MLIRLGLVVGLVLIFTGLVAWFSGIPAAGIPLVVLGLLMFFAARADEKRNAQ